MQDWSKYIERPIVEVLPELEAEGYRVTSDECAIFGFRNIDIEKGSVVAEIVCVPYDYEEYQEGNIAPEDADRMFLYYLRKPIKTKKYETKFG